MVQPAGGKALERGLVRGRRGHLGPGPIERQVRGNDQFGSLDEQASRPQAIGEVCALRLELGGEPAVEDDRAAVPQRLAEVVRIHAPHGAMTGADRVGRIPSGGHPAEWRFRCATGGCRSRRSRPSSWATGGSGATSRRARSPTRRWRTSGVGPRRPRPPVRRPPRPARAARGDRGDGCPGRRTPTTSSSPRARSRRCSSSTRAPRARRPRRRRAAQLRDQRGDAAGHRG